MIQPLSSFQLAQRSAVAATSASLARMAGGGSALARAWMFDELPRLLSRT